MIYFSSDWHLFHTLMIKTRAFNDIDAMNNDIIDTCNVILNSDDELYFLGDLTFGNVENTNALLDKLNFRKYWILGNHDDSKKVKKLSHHFEWIKDYHKLKIKENDKQYRIILSHYPMLTWDCSHYGSWMLHGHCRGSLQAEPTTRLDVGWDVFDRPVSFDEIKYIMALSDYKVCDHHGNCNS